MPDKPRGRAGLAVHGLEHVPVSLQRGADSCGSAAQLPRAHRDQGPGKGIAKRRRASWTLWFLTLGRMLQVHGADLDSAPPTTSTGR
jgi:hypothetical protein